MEDKNILETELRKCSTDPITGFYRDGYCRTGEEDMGTHNVCAEMTDEFLEFTKSQGNDLSTPTRSFPGLNRVIIGVYVLQDGKKRKNVVNILKF